MNKRYIDFVPSKKSAAAAVKKDSPVKPVKPVRQPAKPVAPKVVEKPVSVDEAEVEELPLEEIFVEKEEPKYEEEPVSEEFTGGDLAETEPKFGVIEDFKPHFVKTEVPKRPLNKKTKGGIAVVDKDEEAAPVAVAKEAKPERVGRFGKRKKAKTEAKVEAEAKAKEMAEQSEQIAALEAVRNKKVVARGMVAMRKKPQSTNTSTISSGEINKILDEAFMEAESITRRDRRTMRSTPFVNTEGVEKRPLSGSVATKKRIFVPKEEPSGPVTIIQKPEKDSRVGLIVAIIITIILGATAGTVAFLLLPK